MFTQNRIVVGLQFSWIIVIVWYELGTFFNDVRYCHWPDALLPADNLTPSHVLLVADPQLLDHRSYHRGPFLNYLTEVIVDLNLRKNWQAALQRQPDAVIFLGDMMDGGRFNMPDDEYERYFKRFELIFTLPSQIPAYFIPGNHDIGLRASLSFSPHAHSRFISHFGPLNSQISIANHTLVLLDAPGLVEEDNARLTHLQSFKEWKPVHGGPVEFVKYIAREHKKDPIVLISHIPLARDNTECGPLREKGTIRPGVGYGYQNTLGKEVTAFLLDELRPVMIFSGDDHDYCEHNHRVTALGDNTPIREVSVKSLSMAMGVKRPGFQLLSLIPQEKRQLILTQKTLADVPCLLPDQVEIYLSVYVPLLALSILIILMSNGLLLCSPRLRGHLRASSVSAYPRGEASYIDGSHYHLPHPASTTPSKSSRQTARTSWSFVPFGRHPPFWTRASVWVSSCFRNQTQKPRRRSFLHRCILDVRDVAVFPLGIFIIISLWISR